MGGERTKASPRKLPTVEASSLGTLHISVLSIQVDVQVLKSKFGAVYGRRVAIA